jgi:small nuclear ribonucleoprotein (snRNP)-like protein
MRILYGVHSDIRGVLGNYDNLYTLILSLASEMVKQLSSSKSP